MRTDKELLQLLLGNEEYFREGLCAFTAILVKHNIICQEESAIIVKYIKTHADTERRRMGCSYYWPYNKWKPRKKWLKSEIKKLDGKGSIFTTLKRWFDRF